MHATSLGVCPEGHFSITSPCSIDFLRVLLPFTIIFLISLSYIPYPAPVRKFFSPIAPLFHDPCSLKALVPESVSAEIAELRASGKGRGPAFWRQVVLVTVPMLEVMGWLAFMGWAAMGDGIAQSAGSTVWQVWMPALIALSWLYMLAMHFFRPSPQPPLGSFAIINVHLILSLTSIGSVCFDRTANGAWPMWVTPGLITLEVLNLVACLVLDVTILGMQLLDPEVLARVPTEAEDRVTLWQWMTFTWVDPLIELGARDLKDEDVPELSFTQKTAPVYEVFKATPGKSLTARIMRVNAMDIMIDATLTMLSAALTYFPPYAIKTILESIAIGTPEAMSKAYIFAFAAFFSAVCKSESDVFHLWHARRASIRIKGQLIAAIYEKALQRKDSSGVLAEKDAKGPAAGAKAKGAPESKGKKASDAGKVANLFSGDVNRITNTVSGAYFVYGPLVEIPIAIAFLYSILGWSALVGFVLLIGSMPLNSFLMKRSTLINRDLSKARDKRIATMTELLGSLKFIKFAAWVERFQNKVRDARSEELRFSRRSVMNSVQFNLVWSVVPCFVTLISFSCYVFVAKGKMTAAIAFTAVNLFNQLRQPLGALPAFAVMINQSYVALGRIDEYLSEPNVPDWVCSLTRKASPSSEVPVVGFKNATLSWYTGDLEEETTTNGKTPGAPVEASSVEDEEPRFKLSNLNLKFPDGKFSVVVGPTGAGKSALITALIGEMDLESGDILLRKDPLTVDSKTGLRNGISICTQVPFLQTMSIKNNILFNEAFDEARYKAVLDACSLQTDLDILDDGDETEVGQRGISMSGGQKARIALARAIYARNRFVILDDILSALDAGTSRSVYEKCLLGPLMKGRTLVLVTHHLDLVLPGVAYLVRIIDGNVDCAGTPDELRASGMLDSLVAIEKAEVKVEEPVTNQETIEAEMEAVDGANGEAKAEKPKKEAKKLIAKEEQSTGTIKMEVYMLYIKAAGWVAWSAMFAALALAQVSQLGERFWIKIWSEAYAQAQDFVAAFFFSPATVHESVHQQHYHASFSHMAHFSLNESSISIESAASKPWPNANDHPGFYIAGFAFFMIGTALVSTVVGTLSWLTGYLAGKNLHERLLVRVTRATFRWHDTNPTGRVISRFSRDVENLDGSISSSMRLMLSQVAQLIATFVTVAAIVPQFILPAFLLFFAYYALTRKYLTVVRDLRRFESTRRSPIYSGFGELLDGISVIRAFSMEKLFMDKITEQVDSSQSPFYYLWMVNRWLLIRFDCLGALVILSATIFCLSGKVSGGLAGVAIISANSLTTSLYWISRFSGSLQQDANSIERAQEYLDLPLEPPPVIESSRPPAYWPSDHTKDFLAVENLAVKYAPDLPSVLKGVSFSVKPREKIGVCGRTGSGKSSLAMALLRFVDPAEGKIVLDGIDITTIGVDDLRSNITYINQESTIFSGTVRENLDPFDEHSEDELLEALERVNLGPRANNSPLGSRAVSATNLKALTADGTATPASNTTAVTAAKKTAITLDTEISAGGLSLSAGQRQLLALARALLRRSALIIADEATASIDMATDDLVQRTIRTEFSESCVVTIAHRLSTVVEGDKILVLANGGVAEFDTPWNLIQKEGGVFRDMCEKSGKFEQLKEMASKTALLDV